MNVDGKSDESVVPLTRVNNAGTEPAAESVEERDSAKRNTEQTDPGRAEKRNHRGSSGLHGVREAARAKPDLKFTSLLHHINEAMLYEAFFDLKKTAAVGIDEVTWHDYEQDLEDHIPDLHGRIHRGAYRAKPSKRIYIAKADGRKRPIGIASLEDKLVQKAVVWVLQSIYEQDFVGFSYGFRPGRSQHDALDALSVGIADRKVNWVLDADVEGFFDNIDHDWLMKFLEHRIADKRILRLIDKWLRAGVSDDGEWSETKVGTPQGAVTNSGWFALRRATIAKRLRATIAAIKVKLIQRRHWPIEAVGKWLRRVCQGWLNYHAIPGNLERMKQFLDEVKKLWLAQLRRRSHRHRMPWRRFVRIIARYLPLPKTVHPFPSVRFHARLKAGAV